MRDTQRKRVWRVAYAQKETGEALPTIGDVKRYLKRAWSMQRVRDAWPAAYRRLMPEIHDGRGHRSCWGYRDEIGVPKWARSTPIVTYLLACSIHKRLDHGRPVADHGPEFCMTYLRLSLYLEGREAHDQRKAAFKTAKVRTSPKRKAPPLSQERRYALMSGLAEHRRRTDTANLVVNVLDARDGVGL